MHYYAVLVSNVIIVTTAGYGRLIALHQPTLLQTRVQTHVQDIPLKIMDTQWANFTRVDVSLH